ncbi:hypothetical protein [Paraburkholderia saeva]|uniref:hypothetical protein n=1 Tax=Paraburkholderia saeva TaxID=2777537 RepID=UPI001E2A9F25|nr:hypothetical protein [Paraburkholderia saeva]
MRKFFFLTFMLCIRFSAASAQAQSLPSEDSLCREGEDIYFSCPLENGKTISVCARNNGSPDQGYVRYEYGNKENSFVYPLENMPPGDKFTISDVSEGSIHGLHLKVTSGLYTYVVSSVWPGELYVSKRGDIVFDKQCQASRYKSFSNKIFDGIKLVPPSKVDFH